MSWCLSDALVEVYTTLTRYIEQHNDLDPDRTFFWICSCSIRQSGSGKMEDVLRLGEMVANCGSTVMVLDPWDRMCGASGDKLNALSRVWCVYECFHTLKAEAVLS